MQRAPASCPLDDTSCVCTYRARLGPFVVLRATTGRELAEGSRPNQKGVRKMNQIQQHIQTRTQISRPLKVLIPLIKDELQEGDAAGHEHYRRAGEMLIEARDQVGYGDWSRWLTKNFELSERSARRYMRWARDSGHGVAEAPYASLR